MLMEEDNHNTTTNSNSNTNNASNATVGGLLHEKAVIREAGKQAITEFLESQDCFSVLRYSGKVVVFDTRIPIQLAFYALVEHDMQAAPLWDPDVHEFVGLLTVTDFIDILRFYSKNSSSSSNISSNSNSNNNYTIEELASRSIADILNDSNVNVYIKHSRQFLSADANATLRQSCALLHRNSLDFLPVILPSDMRVLATVTYTHILEHLVTHFREQRRLFDDSIYDLGIGTYGENVATVQPHNTLEECLALCQARQLSAVPIVDENGRILNVYSRSDISFLHHATDAEDAVRSLDKTVGEIILRQQQHHRSSASVSSPGGATAPNSAAAAPNALSPASALAAAATTDVSTPDRLHTCSPTHTLQSIFEYFAQLKFNRLIVVDEEQRVVGVVSARDLVAYFVGDGIANTIGSANNSGNNGNDGGNSSHIVN